MALPQQKFREIVFQLLYSYDLSKTENEDMIPFMMDMLSVTKANMRQAQERLSSICEKSEELDRLITYSSKAYDFERIARVERNILRLAVFELLFDDAIPPKVAIAEAIRLCRKFGTAEGATFVNAVLDALYQSSLKPEEVLT